MNAKEYLLQVRKLEHLISIKKEEIQRLRLTLGYKTVRYDIERVSGGKPVSASETIARIVDYETELEKDVRRYIETKSDVLKTIDQLSDERYISVLYKRYFEFKRFEEISVDMNYHYRWVLKLHGKALLEVNKILQKQETGH